LDIVWVPDVMAPRSREVFGTGRTRRHSHFNRPIALFHREHLEHTKAFSEKLAENDHYARLCRLPHFAAICGGGAGDGYLRFSRLTSRVSGGIRVPMTGYPCNVYCRAELREGYPPSSCSLTAPYFLSRYRRAQRSSRLRADSINEKQSCNDLLTALAARRFSRAVSGLNLAARDASCPASPSCCVLRPAMGCMRHSPRSSSSSPWLLWRCHCRSAGVLVDIVTFHAGRQGNIQQATTRTTRSPI